MHASSRPDKVDRNPTTLNEFFRSPPSKNPGASATGRITSVDGPSCDDTAGINVAEVKNVDPIEGCNEQDASDTPGIIPTSDTDPALARSPQGEGRGTATGAARPTSAQPHFGFLPPEDGTPAYMTFLRAKPLSVALDEIESYGTFEEQAQGLLQDQRFLDSARGKKLVKKLASPETPARARLLEIQQKLDAAKAVKKASDAWKKLRAERAAASR